MSITKMDGMPVSVGEVTPLALYNYGHFTSMLLADGRVKGLDLHLGRLARDCRTIFAADLDLDAVRQMVREATPPGNVVVRVTVFDPNLELGHPGAAGAPRTLVTDRPAPTQPAKPLRAASVTYERDLPQVKHVGLMGTVYHRRAAQLAGFDDALFLDSHGAISEGATWNVMFFDGERAIWPRAEVLPGVTAGLIDTVLKNLGISSVSRRVRIEDLPRMRAAFALNAVVGVRPIAAVDDLTLPGDDDLAGRLSAGYAQLPAERV